MNKMGAHIALRDELLAFGGWPLSLSTTILQIRNSDPSLTTEK